MSKNLFIWAKKAVWAILFAFVLLSCKETDDFPGKGEKGVFAVDIGNSEIPYLVINTQGRDIQYEPKIPATLKVYEKGLLSQETRIGIEYRGKTSFRVSDKKGFNIETINASGQGVDVSFFGMPAEEDWRLIGHVVNLGSRFAWDRSLMYNHVGYELSRMIGRYASRTKFVELEVNGEYMGVYVFAEKLKRDSNRINISSLNAGSSNITGGYILTIDKSSVGAEGIGKPLSYFYNNWDDDARYTAGNSFRSNYDIFKRPLTFPAFRPPYHPEQYLETYFLYEYPSAENITAAQKRYIADYVDNFETALIRDNFGTGQRTYTEWIDVSSFVDYFLIVELCRVVDAYRISTYLQKDRNGKLAMGPVWDLNIGFDETDRIPMNDWVMRYNNYTPNDPWMVPFWWPRLMEDPVFRQAIKTRWTALRRNEWTDAKMTQLVDRTAKYLKDNGAVARNYQKWNVGVDYDASVQSLKAYLQQRAAWMDAVIGQF